MIKRAGYLFFFFIISFSKSIEAKIFGLGQLVVSTENVLLEPSDSAEVRLVYPASSEARHVDKFELLSSQLIAHIGDMLFCLTVKEDNVLLSACDTTVDQSWTYDVESGHIIDHIIHRCLTATGSYSSLFMADCSPENEGQVWFYENPIETDRTFQIIVAFDEPDFSLLTPSSNDVTLTNIDALVTPTMERVLFLYTSGNRLRLRNSSLCLERERDVARFSTCNSKNWNQVFHTQISFGTRFRAHGTLLCLTADKKGHAVFVDCDLTKTLLSSDSDPRLSQYRSQFPSRWHGIQDFESSNIVYTYNSAQSNVHLSENDFVATSIFYLKPNDDEVTYSISALTRRESYLSATPESGALNNVTISPVETNRLKLRFYESIEDSYAILLPDFPEYALNVTERAHLTVDNRENPDTFRVVPIDTASFPTTTRVSIGSSSATFLQADSLQFAPATEGSSEHIWTLILNEDLQLYALRSYNGSCLAYNGQSLETCAGDNYYFLIIPKMGNRFVINSVKNNDFALALFPNTENILSVSRDLFPNQFQFYFTEF